MDTDRHRHRNQSSFSISASLRLCGLVLVLAAIVISQTKDFTRWVNPFIGTGGHGHTFPGAVMPFGMVQLSPDTREANWDGSSGYHYSDDIIYGFSHTHLSGTGIPDGCDILFMPTIGDHKLAAEPSGKNPNGFVSKFSHLNERAEPGYYSVRLDDSGILAELTATSRVGFHRYTFPSTDTGNVVIALNWRDKVLASQLKIADRYHIEGFRRSTSWAKDQTVYFVAEFSEPVDNISSTLLPSAQVNDNEANTTNLSFRLKANKQLLIKVAISFVSVEGARRNLNAELPGWDFDKVRANAKAAWNKELSKIEVSGGTDAQTTVFYTALYHTMIHPSLFNDVDGNYRGLDGKIHNVRQTVSLPKRQANSLSYGDQYTVFSLWDTFRAAHPLYTIIDQKRTVDFINTFIRMYEQGGRLPVWELWGNETDTMIGYHAVSVIADAMAKGIKGFDYEKAYEAAKHSAMLDRDGLAAYKRRGYISMEDENESVSKTLEYAYDDWCIAKMAEILINRAANSAVLTTGNAKASNELVPKQLFVDFETFSKRARYFENLFDPATSFMRPKKNGGFISPFKPNEVTFNYTEGNAWVYSFFVPQDLEQLIRLMGGHEMFYRRLNSLFTTTDKLSGREQPDITGLIGQYAHGNEPSHHIAYLFDAALRPSKTQEYVHKILSEFYKPTPDGLIGNEDCGQMSAWYVLSASGFYQVTPGNPWYSFGSPIFKEVKFHLENGKVFTIRANNVSATNFYIKSSKLNGKAYDAAYIRHRDIVDGGLLEFEMSDRPVDAFTTIPSSQIDLDSVSVPIINSDGRVFSIQTNVALSSVTQNASIYFTTDGSEPSEKSTKYVAPIVIDKTSTIKAIAVNPSGARSLISAASFSKKPNNWTVKYDTRYSYQYTGGGDEGLIDGIRGTMNFASGEWQGYQGKDFIATVDLQKQQQILMLGAGFLQNVRSWIWMPTHVEFELSQDGVNFSRVADIQTDIATTDMESKIRDYSTPIKPSEARYVRIHAYNLGKIPSWHPGAGGDPWIFVDEIIVK